MSELRRGFRRLTVPVAPQATLQRALLATYPDVAALLRTSDLFINVPGGLRLLDRKQADPTADLARRGGLAYRWYSARRHAD
jgi:hypothetical protein